MQRRRRRMFVRLVERRLQSFGPCSWIFSWSFLFTVSIFFHHVHFRPICSSLCLTTRLILTDSSLALLLPVILQFAVVAVQWWSVASTFVASISHLYLRYFQAWISWNLDSLAGLLWLIPWSSCCCSIGMHSLCSWVWHLLVLPDFVRKQPRQCPPAHHGCFVPCSWLQMVEGFLASLVSCWAVVAFCTSFCSSYLSGPSGLRHLVGPAWVLPRKNSSWRSSSRWQHDWWYIFAALWYWPCCWDCFVVPGPFLLTRCNFL